MASAETIYGSVTGYIFETDGDRTRFIPEEALTPGQKTFIENNYTAGGPLETDLNGLTDPATGKDAVLFYRQFSRWYDPAYAQNVVKDPVPAVSASYDQAEVNGIVDTLNAVRKLV